MHIRASAQVYDPGLSGWALCLPFASIDCYREAGADQPYGRRSQRAGRKITTPSMAVTDGSGNHVAPFPERRVAGEPPRQFF